MINTLKPGSANAREGKSDAIQRVMGQYQAPEEKQRETVKKMGKDEFFKIMITQLQHQDPTKPYENEQMAAQMAQFTALEQMVNMNQNIEKLTSTQQPLHQLASANLIGKYVTADSSRIIHTEGKISDIKFSLPEDASQVHVVLINEKGENVREMDLNAQTKGEVKVPWDGKLSNGLPAPGGTYLMQFQAEAASGKPIQIQTQRTDVVHGISFDGKETVLLVGDIRSPQKLLLRNVAKIVDANQISQAGVQPQTGQVQVPTHVPQIDPKALAELINSQERAMPGFKPGVSSKYSSGAVPNLKQGPDPMYEKKKLQEARESMIRPPESRSDTSDRKSVPSSADGSVAGNWTE